MIDKLTTCINRYDAEEILKGFKKSEIENIARVLKIPVYIYKTKQSLIDKIVEDTVGARLKDEAIMSINLK